MNARDIIAEWLGSMHDDDYQTPGDHLTALLWEAAGAAEGDTITIGPDGTVGRLERHGNTYGTIPGPTVYRVATPSVLWAS